MVEDIKEVEEEEVNRSVRQQVKTCLKCSCKVVADEGKGWCSGKVRCSGKVQKVWYVVAAWSMQTTDICATSGKGREHCGQPLGFLKGCCWHHRDSWCYWGSSSDGTYSHLQRVIQSIIKQSCHLPGVSQNQLIYVWNTQVLYHFH